MKQGQPSRTALGAAYHRAAHQALEGGAIFNDPLALRILGSDADTALSLARSDPSRRMMRTFVAARARFAEDSLAAAVTDGVCQLVVLGAGLDTYAYRSTLGDKLRIFESTTPRPRPGSGNGSSRRRSQFPTRLLSLRSISNGILWGKVFLLPALTRLSKLFLPGSVSCPISPRRPLLRRLIL